MNTPPSDSINHDEHFQNLSRSSALTNLLIQRARDYKTPIEATCLYITHIDAILRIAIIFHEIQKDPKNKIFNRRLVYQDDNETSYKEREIYSIALEKKIIDKTMFEKLSSAFEYRNKVVHRFNISNITYEEILEKCNEFESLDKEILQILANIEHPDGVVPDLSAEGHKKLKDFINIKMGR